MKAIVAIEFTDADRATLQRQWGQARLPNKRDLEQFIRSCVDGALVDYRTQHNADDAPVED